MKYVRFEINNKVEYGVLNEDVITTLDKSFFEKAELTDKKYHINEVRLLSPVVPSKALCIGFNYRDHAKEFNLPIPTEPIIFMKASTSVIGPEDKIVYPPLSKKLDFEAELCVVIGKTARNIKIEEVDDYIFGYTCANDVTARDLQFKTGQWTLAKGFDTFLPLGPFIETDIDPTKVDVQCYLNGELKQSSNTKNLVFNHAYLVSYLSKFMTLNVGDVILTGTPSGTTSMVEGDTVEVKIQGLGTLRNTVINQK